METLIVYYSFTQNNAALARIIQQRLDCEMLKVETLRRRSAFSIFLDAAFGRKPAILKHNLPMANYEHFVFVGPIWLGKIAGPLKTFLSEEKGNIKRYSFISVCGGLTGQKEKIEDELTSIVGSRPQSVCELWVSEIVSEKVTKNAKNVSAYRIRSAELEKFKTKIDEFCDAIEGEMVK
jgi:flavodoxin